MITIYKKSFMPKHMELIVLNDIYFNRYTVEMLDDKAVKIISTIDNSEMLGRYMIRSRFDGSTLNIDKLSTGCKTILNIVYNTEKIFDIRECGDNALDVVYSLPQGNIYCDYPYISFGMQKVNVCDKDGIHEISSYEELKDWWTNED